MCHPLCEKFFVPQYSLLLPEYMHLTPVKMFVICVTCKGGTSGKTLTFTSKQLPAPIKLVLLVNFLEGYDLTLIQFFKNGFNQGFPLHYAGKSFTEEK